MLTRHLDVSSDSQVTIKWMRRSQLAVDDYGTSERNAMGKVNINERINVY